MKIKNWLTINSRGSARLTKSKPGINPDEISMELNIEIPDSVFKRPQLKATVKIDGEMNYEYDFKVQKALEDVINAQPNIHLVKIDVLPKEEEKDGTD